MRLTTKIAALALLGALGCGSIPPGSLLHQPANSRLASGGAYSIAVALPRDSRPAVEHTGDTPHTRVFIPLIFFWWIEKRGNWVTGDESCSPNAMLELGQLETAYLQRTGAFTNVIPGNGPADFVLETEVLHLYATYHEARRTTVVIWGDKKGPTDYHQTTSKAAFAPYGNAVLRYSLYDTRKGRRNLVWQRTVTASSQQPPEQDSLRLLPQVVREAAVRAMGAMALYVTRAVEEYAPPPFDAAAYLAYLEQQRQGGQLGFVVERHSKRRTASELLTIDALSGRVVNYRVAPNVATPIGRPGDWLLSRERPDGTLMPYVEYAALASFLSQYFDLRRVDDIYHFHFFGRLGQARMARPPGPAVARAR